MKVLLAILFSLIIQLDVSLANLEFKCLKRIKPIYGITNEILFDAKDCEELEDIQKDLHTWGIIISISGGLQFDDFSFSIFNTLDEAIELLATDHMDGDGSEPFSAEELDQVREFYDQNHVVGDIWYGELWNNYMSGTGVTGYVIMFTDFGDKVMLIEKFMYAE